MPNPRYDWKSVEQFIAAGIYQGKTDTQMHADLRGRNLPRDLYGENNDGPTLQAFSNHVKKMRAKLAAPSTPFRLASHMPTEYPPRISSKQMHNGNPESQRYTAQPMPHVHAQFQTVGSGPHHVAFNDIGAAHENDPHATDFEDIQLDPPWTASGDGCSYERNTPMANPSGWPLVNSAYMPPIPESMCMPSTYLQSSESLPQFQTVGSGPHHVAFNDIGAAHENDPDATDSEDFQLDPLWTASGDGRSYERNTPMANPSGWPLVNSAYMPPIPEPLYMPSTYLQSLEGPPQFQGTGLHITFQDSPPAVSHPQELQIDSRRNAGNWEGTISLLPDVPRPVRNEGDRGKKRRRVDPMSQSSSTNNGQYDSTQYISIASDSDRYRDSGMGSSLTSRSELGLNLFQAGRIANDVSPSTELPVDGSVSQQTIDNCRQVSNDSGLKSSASIVAHPKVGSIEWFAQIYGIPCSHEDQNGPWRDEHGVCRVCRIAPVLEGAFKYAKNTKDVCNFLKWNQSQLDCTDMAGNTILHYAAAGSASCDTLKSIVTLGVPSSLVNSNGEAFLHLVRPDSMLGKRHAQPDWERLLVTPKLHLVLGYVNHKGDTIRQCWSERIRQSDIVSRTDRVGLERDVNGLFESLGFGKDTENQEKEYFALHNLLANQDPERKKLPKLLRNTDSRWWNDLQNLLQSKTSRNRTDTSGDCQDAFEVPFNPCAQDHDGNTALMKYVGITYKKEAEANKVVRKLFSCMRQWKMADGVNMKNAQGKTALHYAASSGNVGMTGALMDEGANPNACDAEGKSVLQWNYEAMKDAHKRDSGLFASLKDTHKVLVSGNAELRPTILQQFTKTKPLNDDDRIAQMDQKFAQMISVS